MIEERHRAVGERRHRPREIEIAPAGAGQRIALQQADGVLHDRDPRRGAGAFLGHARLGAEGVMAQRGVSLEDPPSEGEHHERRAQRDAHAGREPGIDGTPEGEHHHADHARAGGAEQHAENEEEEQHVQCDGASQRSAQTAGEPTALRQPHGRDARPHQQTREVIGLAHVADRATHEPRACDDVAVGQRREEHLDEADDNAQQTSADEGNAEERQHLVSLVGHHGATRLHCKQRAEQHRNAGQRHGPGEPMGERRRQRDGGHQQQGKGHAVVAPACAQGASPRQTGDQQPETCKGHQLVVKRGRRRLVECDQRGERDAEQEAQQGEELAVGLRSRNRVIGGRRRRGERHGRSGS